MKCIDFITNLQSITTSTVSTLSETIRKLKTDDINTQSVCTICKEYIFTSFSHSLDSVLSMILIKKPSFGTNNKSLFLSVPTAIISINSII